MAALAAPNLASDALSALHARKRALRVERERVAKQLRYEERKRDRLLEKAKNLSDQDLMSLMAGRAQARAEAEAKVKAKGKAAATAKAKAKAKSAPESPEWWRLGRLVAPPKSERGGMARLWFAVGI